MSVQSLAQETVWGKQESIMKNAYKSVHFGYMMQDYLTDKFRVLSCTLSSYTNPSKVSNCP